MASNGSDTRTRLIYASKTDNASTSSITFSLVELPADILRAIEEAHKTSSPLELNIKGLADDDAVLCTADSTYSIRESVNSNSLLICKPELDEENKVQISILSTQHKTLEINLTRPRTERVLETLAGQAWNGDISERPNKRLRRLRTTDIYEEVQASEEQIDSALVSLRILEIEANRRPIGPKTLSKLLHELLLSVSSNSFNVESLDSTSLAATFADECDTPLEIARQIVGWYTRSLNGGDNSRLDLEAVARDSGKVLLESWEVDSAVPAAQKGQIPLNSFLSQWRVQMTDDFSYACKLDLLAGEHIYNPQPSPHLISLPSRTLPLEPQRRFNYLFKMRSRWSPEDLSPFLKDVGLNDKEREKWILKCARKVKGQTGATELVAR